MKQPLIPLTQLNLTNRFLFDEVMDDAQTHQDVLSIILGRDIPLLEQNDSEKEHRIHKRVCKVRTNEQVGVRYMQAWEERIYDKEEAREEGFSEGMCIRTISLVKRNLSKGVSVLDIAQFMGETEDSVEKIADMIRCHPEADEAELYRLLYPSEEE